MGTPTSPLASGRRLLIAALLCAIALWAAGPAPRMLIALALLMGAPGYLIERALPGPRPTLLLRLALWVGLSLSAVTLAYLWCWMIGLALTTPLLASLAAILAIVTTLAAWRDLRGESAPLQAPREAPHPREAQGYGPHPPSPAILLALMSLATLWVRFEQIADLALPAWVDSVHHALLIRIAAERGMVPTDLTPALPITRLTYHWGYHVLMAAQMQLSGLALPETLLWPGQLINTLLAPLAGALALALWRRPMAAPVAALVVGLISLMPAYYVTWGRYTQLTGLLLLPGLAIAWQMALARSAGGRDRPVRSLRPHRSARPPAFFSFPVPPVSSSPWWLACALMLAGLFLIHVRVLAFTLALLAAQSIVWAPGADRRALRAALLGAGGAAIGALTLVAPWLFVLIRQALLPALSRPGSLASEASYAAINTGLLWAGHTPLLVALALLGGLWALWRRSRAAMVLALWVGLLVLLMQPWLLSYLLPAVGAPLLIGGLRLRRLPLIAAGLLLLLGNPWLLRLPPVWLINADSVVISLFLPIGALIGGAAAGLFHNLRAEVGPRLRALLGPLAALLLIGLAGWGAWQSRAVVNPTTVLATAADRAAIAWVAENTPPDSRFLINAAPWLGVAARSVDGGWWLLPLADRWASVPPVLFTFGPLGYAEEVIARNRTVIGFQPGDEAAILELIRRDGIDYLYFGPRAGPLKPAMFAGLPGFSTVYERDGVTILAVRSQS